MPDDPSVPPSELEHVDALRPDDVNQTPIPERLASEPSLRRWLDRLREFDVAVTEAIADVPVPADLAARIMAMLPAATLPADPTGVVPVEPEAALPAVPTPEPDPMAALSAGPTEAAVPRFEGARTIDVPARDMPGSGGSRRRMLRPLRSTVGSLRATSPRVRRWLAAGAALAACAAFVTYVVWRPVEAWQPETAAAEALAFFQQEQARIAAGDEPPGRPASPGQQSSEGPPAEFPFSRAVREPIGLRWQRIDGLLDRSGIAYYLPSAGNRQATLYVVPLGGRRPFVDLAGQPPRNPPSTLGCTVAVWKERGQLYVLVAQGNEGFYRSLLRPRNMTT